MNVEHVVRSQSVAFELGHSHGGEAACALPPTWFALGLIFEVMCSAQLLGRSTSRRHRPGKFRLNFLVKTALVVGIIVLILASELNLPLSASELLNDTKFPGPLKKAVGAGRSITSVSSTRHH